MPEWLLPVLLGLLAAGLASAVPSLLARRRRTALARGGVASFRVRLAGSSAPYPLRPRRGVLRLGPDALTWSARSGGPVLDLLPSGITGIRIREGRRGDRAGRDDAVLVAADGLGSPVRLVGGYEALEQLADLLRARPLPVAPSGPTLVQAGRTTWLALGWPVPVALLGLLVAGAVGAMMATSVRVTATVLDEPDRDGYCSVAWVDPRDGSRQVNGVDCYDEVGDRVDFLALAGPLRGEVLSPEDGVLWLVVGGVLVLVAVGGAVQQQRHRRQDRDSPPPATGAAPPPASEVGPDQLSHEEVTRAVRARARAEAWAFDPDPAAGPLTDRVPRRAVLVAVGTALLPLVGGLLGALLIGWTALAGAVSSMGPVRVVTAQVDDELYEIAPLLPGELQVTFPLDGGGSETTLVSVRGLPDPEPDRLRIAYSLADPDRAWAQQYDGVPVGVAAALAVVLVGTTWTGWRLWVGVRHDRRERQAAQGPARHVPYVLVVDLDDDPLLLLWDHSFGRPRYAVLPLEDPRGRIAGSGVLEIRGPWEDEGHVVAKVAGRRLPLASPLLEMEETDVLDLLNGREPEWADQPG